MCKTLTVNTVINVPRGLLRIEPEAREIPCIQPVRSEFFLSRVIKRDRATRSTTSTARYNSTLREFIPLMASILPPYRPPFSPAITVQQLARGVPYSTLVFPFAELSATFHFN